MNGILNSPMKSCAFHEIVRQVGIDGHPLYQCFSNFSPCDSILLKMFVKPTMKNCGKATRIKLKYENEITYKQYKQLIAMAGVLKVLPQ